MSTHDRPAPVHDQGSGSPDRTAGQHAALLRGDRRDPADQPRASSGHRVYDEDDLDQLTWVACLAATGMSVSDMRQYVANGPLGASAAPEQIALLSEQQQRLAAEAEQLALRQRYVALKIDYWHAVEAGDDARAELISGDARALADGLKRVGSSRPDLNTTPARAVQPTTARTALGAPRPSEGRQRP